MTPQSPVPSRPSSGRVVGSIVWALTPLLSLGVLSPIIFVIAWIRRRTFTAFLSFVFYSSVFIWVVASNDGPQEQLGTNVHILVLWLFATAHAFVVRPKVWYPKTAAAPTAHAVPAAATLPPPVPFAQPVFPADATARPGQHKEPVPPPPTPEPEPAAESATPDEDTAPTTEPQTDDPLLGRAQDEPVIALVALTLLDAGDAAAIPLARFEQRFFGNFRPGPAELRRFADAGWAQIRELAVTDPATAEAAHRRAEAILAELGAESLMQSGGTREPRTPTGPTAPARGPETETSEQPDEATAPTAPLLDDPPLGKQVCDSETYRAHIKGMRRFPDSSVVASIIDAAQNAGGVLTATEVGRIAGRPLASVDGYVSQLQRALNIDGAQVLSKQDKGASIRLDFELLRQQFLGGHR